MVGRKSHYSSFLDNGTKGHSTTTSYCECNIYNNGTKEINTSMTNPSPGNTPKRKEKRTSEHIHFNINNGPSLLKTHTYESGELRDESLSGIYETPRESRIL
jgi:hypothetical protein